MKRILFEAVDISKKIEGKLILHDTSFQVQEHTATAILGQNGSGKSTLLKLLAGLYEPTTGKLQRNTRKIGFVPEHFPENIRFKVKEYLFLMGAFHGMSKKDIEIELSKYVELLELEPFLDMPLKECSKGTKQKVGILQALLTKPETLLLDEPLTGLDAASQQQLIQILEHLKDHVTIIFTTHEKIMVEKLAKKTLNIVSGKVSLSTAVHKKEKKLITVQIPGLEVLKDLKEYENEGNIAWLEVEAGKSDQVLLDLLNKKCSVLEVREKR